MAKNQLTDAFCKIAPEGEHADGGGLVLRVRNDGSHKSWTLRKMIKGRRHMAGLGGYPSVSLADARKAAKAMAAQLTGNGPAEPVTVAPESEPTPKRSIMQDLVRRAVPTPPTGPTFAEMTTEALKLHGPALADEKQISQWLASLTNHAFPIIGDMAIADITPSNVMDVLEPIWLTKAEMATKVRQRMRRIFDYAIVKGHRLTANPVEPVTSALPRRSNLKQHQPSLPPEQVGSAIKTVQNSCADSATKLALEFVILTAARHGEVRKMTWAEVAGDVWVIPFEHMKMRRTHRVPLSGRAMEILAEARKFGDSESDSLVFPGENGTVINSDTFGHLLRRQEVECVPHGFRASFRTWAMEQPVSWAACERALAHKIGGSEVEAYARGDMLDERRGLMQAWADFIAEVEPTE